MFIHRLDKFYLTHGIWDGLKLFILIFHMVVVFPFQGLVVIQDMLRVFIVRIAFLKVENASLLLEPILSSLLDYISNVSFSSDTDNYKVIHLLPPVIFLWLIRQYLISEFLSGFQIFGLYSELIGASSSKGIGLIYIMLPYNSLRVILMHSLINLK